MKVSFHFEHSVYRLCSSKHTTNLYPLIFPKYQHTKLTRPQPQEQILICRGRKNESKQKKKQKRNTPERKEKKRNTRCICDQQREQNKAATRRQRDAKVEKQTVSRPRPNNDIVFVAPSHSFLVSIDSVAKSASKAVFVPFSRTICTAVLIFFKEPM